MRLLLDEHLSPEVAAQLRGRGHEVIAVAERPELRGLTDRDHFEFASSERRVIVSGNLRDFRPMLSQALHSGSPAYGLICLPRRFSLARRDVGDLVRALEALLKTHPEDDSLIRRGGEIWLEDAPPAG